MRIMYFFPCSRDYYFTRYCRFFVTSGVFGEKAAANSTAGRNLRKGRSLASGDDVETTSSRSKRHGSTQVDFDEEGRKLLSIHLNLGSNGLHDPKAEWNDYDAIYRSRKGRGTMHLTLTLTLALTLILTSALALTQSLT